MTSRNTINAELKSARARLDQGDDEGGLDALRAALTQGSFDYDVWQGAGRIFWAHEAYGDAVDASNEADKVDPLGPQFQQIRRAIAQKNLAEAGRIAHAMLVKSPGHPRALYTLAHIARTERDPLKYLGHVKDGLKTAPGNMILRHMLVSAYEDMGDEQAALTEARRLPEIDRTAASILELGRVLQRYGMNEELLELFASAEGDVSFTNEQRGGMELVRGHILRIEGQTDDAVRAYHRCVKTRTPASLEAWWALSDLTTYEFSEAEIKELEAIVGNASIPASARCQPAFALAKARESASGLETALDDYHRANALYQARTFDPVFYTNAIKKVVASIKADTLNIRASEASVDAASGRPVFVLGMPRSGSTLVEQILASHSQIEGTHELPALSSVKQSLHHYCVDVLGGSYLDKLGDIPQAELEQAGAAYLSQTAMFRREHLPFFVDKMPQNFEHIGLIHKILPQAIIIDVRRHPMSCGLSLYRQYFATGWSWAYDLSQIGTYYRGYATLMDHWDNVLPGKVLHMNYETVVSNTRQAIEAMLSHIGVPFEESCVSFYDNRRAVRTPSSEQVRQPVYNSSVDSWRKVGDRLGRLREALGSDLIQRYEKTLTNV